jgi:hypothetical protein
MYKLISNQGNIMNINISDIYLNKIVILYLSVFCVTESAYGQTNQTMTLERGCWYKQIDKTREKNTLSFCFQSDNQMHIVHGRIGGELDAAPETWFLKKRNKIIIGTEVCKIKYVGKIKLELSECLFDGVFDRK